MKTFIPKAGDIQRNWHVVDASGKVLGRLATEVAQLLRGKKKPYFTPHLDTGDFVVVINADKVVISGKKPTIKIYHHYSGYPGGLRQEKFAELQKRRPQKIIELAVKGMLPHNRLGRRLFTKLKVYGGSKHPHAAQNPQPYEIN